jgi:hypothetical protein
LKNWRKEKSPDFLLPELLATIRSHPGNSGDSLADCPRRLLAKYADL